MTALRWSDIDLDAGLIHIRRAHWHGIVDTTKTHRTRTVPLTSELARVLREHRRLLLSTQHPGLASGLVFPSMTGGLRWTRTIHKPFEAALRAAGIHRRQTIHGLRRTFNNLVRQVASGEVVRSMTGHVTEKMTEHYSHVDHSEKSRAVIRAFGELAGGVEVGTEVGTPTKKGSKA